MKIKLTNGCLARGHDHRMTAVFIVDVGFSEERAVMGILPGTFRVTAAPHRWPYGHNQTGANVPAVSSVIRCAIAKFPDGCDPAADLVTV